VTTDGYVVKHVFVELMPTALEKRTLYISVKYKTAVHLCLCGCGRKVVTPLSPAGWRMTFDGRTVSLYPSIGNWNLECRSHYWISNSRVKWAEAWTRDRVEAGFARDEQLRRAYYESTRDGVGSAQADVGPAHDAGSAGDGVPSSPTHGAPAPWWKRLRARIARFLLR
jgi:hypothetical protein